MYPVPEGLVTKILDKVTGAADLQRIELEAMDVLRAEGIPESTDTTILKKARELYLGRQQIGERGFFRALDRLGRCFLITQRHVFATEALANNLPTGTFYKIHENTKVPPVSFLSEGKSQIKQPLEK